MKQLPMRDDEIANSYRLAKDPEEQMTVLAELNATTPEEIEQIVKERGVYVPPVPKNQKPEKQRVRHRWTMGERERAMQMRRGGYSYREIAKELGTEENSTRITVGKWMREATKTEKR